MTPENRSPISAVVFAVAMGGLAIGAWWWRFDVIGSTMIDVPAPSWEHVKDHFPMPPAIPEEPAEAGEILQTFMDANPFSVLRRYAPPPVEQSAERPTVEEPGRTVLKYKGRIQLGRRQRAVLEDVTAGKTHFLQVGQVVAGYKVLDISEEQVLLSDPQTNEEVALFRASEERPPK